MKIRYISFVILVLVIIGIVFISGCIKQDKEVILGMSQFEVTLDETGKQVYKAKDAKIWIVHPNENWKVQEIINPDSNVAHKGVVGDMDGDNKNELYVIGGQKATLKVYNFVDGIWHSKMVWKPDFIRVRDIEIGDVDNDGKNELVMGTHDKGVVEVFDYENEKYSGKEVYRKNNTYIHEIEIGDFDGDGINEFFATPTDPNVEIGMLQLGSIVMFKWNGNDYDKTTIEDITYTHTKEIAVGDIDNDGENELVAVLWGVAKKANASTEDIEKGIVEAEVEIPVYIKKYKFVNNEIESEIIGEISGEIKARSLAIGDIDNDGENELIVGTNTKGLQIIYKKENKWVKYFLDRDLIGNIHALFIADFDNDGKNELIANSDNMGIVKVYKWTGNAWSSKIAFKTPPGDWVWAMDFGNVDND